MQPLPLSSPLPRNRAVRKRKQLNAFGKGSKERFVMLDFWLLESEAWRALSHGARCLYIETRQRFNGRNNGHISFSVREAAEKLHANKDTAAKWFKELVAKGFLKPRKPGSFDFKKRHATEWIITAERCNGELATKDFMRWKPGGKIQNTVPPKGTDSPTKRDRGAQIDPRNAPDGPTEGDREPPKIPSDGPKNSDTYSIPCGKCRSESRPAASASSAEMIPPLPAFLDRR